jgi:aminoglycoside N3'-acetyltransferase
MDSHYNRRQLADALKMIGLKSGDVVFSHSNVGFLGVPQEGNTAEAIFQTILGWVPQEPWSCLHLPTHSARDRFSIAKIRLRPVAYSPR